MDADQDRAIKEPRAYVELRGIRRQFGDTIAVNDLSLAVRRGEIFALLGPSGCGKTTLLRIIAGLERRDAGGLWLAGRDIGGLPPHRRPVNMMFQSYALFPHMTVSRNIAFGLKQDRLPRAEIRARTDELLELVQLSGMGNRRPAQLSGGQQQRVALARSLARQPSLLLLDEPMAALDRRLREQMQFELADIIRRVRVTCIMVTHDRDEAMVMADRLALMDRGRIVQTGTPAEVYELPNSRFSARFLGRVNLLEGRVLSCSEGLAVLDVPGIAPGVKVFTDQDLAVGQQACIALRPEKLRLGQQQAQQRHNAAEAVVEDIGYFGSHLGYQLRLPGGALLTATAGTDTRLQHGASVSLAWDIRDGVLLVS